MLNDYFRQLRERIAGPSASSQRIAGYWLTGLDN